MNLTFILAWLVLCLGAINLVRLAVFLVGSDIYGLKLHLKKQRKTKTYTPLFSVVIPAHNEEKTIINCLESVFAADYPRHRLQVIVADDGSTDRTAALVRQYKDSHNLDALTILTMPHGGKAHALNAAMQIYALGELVMCLDSDSTIEPNALINAAAHFQDPRVTALAANVKITNDGSLLSLIQQFEYLICYQMKRAQTIFNVEYIVGGIGSTFRQSMLDKVGFYDTDTVTEDIDLTMKIITEGNKQHRVAYGADVVVHTQSVQSIPGLIKQRFRWKYGRCQTFWKNRKLFFNKESKYSRFLTWGYLPFAIFSDVTFLLEPVVVGFLLYVTIRFRDPWTLLGALIVIISYIVINILAEDTLAWSEKLKLIPLAPTMYIFFYTLSFVEYLALLKSIPKLWTLQASLAEGVCTWEHVARNSSVRG